MQIAKNEWIMVGAGKLFSAPFFSRVLLFRLHDIGSSFLVYHDETHVVSDVNTTAMAPKIPDLVNINLGHVVMATKVPGSPSVSTHYCASSSSIAFEDLMNLPARRMSFDECASGFTDYGKIAFRIEPFLLPCSKRLLLAHQGRPTQNFSVEGSNYAVTGPVSSNDWPDRVAKDQIKWNCWRVCLCCMVSNGMREFKEYDHWSVAALEVGEEGQLDSMVQMEPNTAATAQVNSTRQP